MWTTTVGTRFKEQLSSLMRTIQATHVHYVRCVKPNPASQPDVFDAPLVTDQLRCAGMLEAIRIARAAYPNRLPCQAFLQLFGGLAAAVRPLPSTSADVRARAEAAAATLLPDGGYVVGKTKVFLRPGVMPRLEARRSERRTAAATVLQRCSRGLSARRMLSAARAAARVIQAWTRRRAAHRLARSRLAAILFISRCSRGRLCRRAYAAKRRGNAAVRLQTSHRAAVARRSYEDVRNKTMRVQAHARRKAASRRVAAALEREKVKRSYEGQLLEARERLAAEAEEKAEVEAERMRLEQATGNLQEQLRQQQAEHAKEVSRLLDVQEAELRSLRAQLETTKAALEAESERRATEARRVEQLTLQLNMERANHQKAQRALDSEKAAHAAAKARIKATHSSLSAAAAAADVDAVASSSCSSPSVSDSATAREAAVAREHLARESLAAAREMTTTIEGLRAELAASQARETQAKSKLAHATAERQKDKAKLERVLSNQRLKESEWMSERTEAMRRSGYLQAELNKREAWLAKAKGIIFEYQKRAQATMIPNSQQASAESDVAIAALPSQKR